MGFRHPIGDDHPFPAVHALAQAKGLTELEMVNVYDGALIRLYCAALHLVFKRKGDPGSAMDRQRFDYHKHVFLEHTTPEQMLREIEGHIAERKAAS